MVRLRRLELPQGLTYSDLNAARLPIPPQPHCPKRQLADQAHLKYQIIGRNTSTKT